MRHAYLITAHSNVELLKITFKLIDDERNDIYLLIDKKSKYYDQNVFFDLRMILKKSNLTVLPPINVNWGGTPKFLPR